MNEMECVKIPVKIIYQDALCVVCQFMGNDVVCLVCFVKRVEGTVGVYFLHHVFRPRYARSMIILTFVKNLKWLSPAGKIKWITPIENVYCHECCVISVAYTPKNQYNKPLM